MVKTLSIKKPVIGHEEYPKGLRKPMTFAEQKAKEKIQLQFNALNQKILAYAKYKFDSQESTNSIKFTPQDFQLDIYDNSPKDANNDYSILGIMGLGVTFELSHIRQSIKRKLIQKSKFYKGETLKKYLGGVAGVVDNRIELKKLIGIDIGVTPSDQVLLGIIQDRKNGIARVLERTTLEKLDKILSEGISSGSSFEDITHNIQIGLGMDGTRAELIARSESNWALNEGQRKYATELGITQFQVSLADDACEDCRAETNDGSKIYDIGEEDILPIHPNCRCMMYSVIPDSWFDNNNLE